MTERFKTLSEAEMTPEQRQLAHAIISGPRKAMRGPFQALLRSPDFGDVVQKFGEYVRFRSILPEPLKEFAIMLTARHWTAQFEWFAHRQLGEKAGLAPAIGDAVARGARPSAMSADETMIYDFVTELLRTSEVSDRNFDTVKARFGERGVVELICTLGYYSTVSMILNVHRHDLPEGATPLPKLAK
jgi:4-carboxymuconolactone decarboxylase